MSVTLKQYNVFECVNGYLQANGGLVWNVTILGTDPLNVCFLS